MSDLPERDRSLLGLVERIMRRPEPAAPAISGDGDGSLAELIPDEPLPASLEPQMAIESTRAVNRRDLAGIILRALQAIDGCPARGLEVTVYGSRPWNAMLRITPAAGPLPDAAAWRERVQNMVPLLREQYDLVEEAEG